MSNPKCHRRLQSAAIGECPNLPRSSRRIPQLFFPQTTTVNVEPSSAVCLLISGFTVLITTVEYRHYDFDEQKQHCRCSPKQRKMCTRYGNEPFPLSELAIIHYLSKLTVTRRDMSRAYSLLACCLLPIYIHLTNAVDYVDKQ